MSRHRAVRDLNLQDELEDTEYDEYDDAGYDDMDEEQQAQMESGTIAVRNALGQQSIITDKDIKEALWNFYFDVDESVSFLLDEKSKREAIQSKKEVRRKQQASSTTNSGTSTPTLSQSNSPTISKSGKGQISNLQTELNNKLKIQDNKQSTSSSKASAPEDAKNINSVPSITKDKIIQEIREAEQTSKPVLSLVVIGHVDAGKSTLMGRLLHDLGEVSEREVMNNQRQSERIGKGSFAYAWTFDATKDERERGVTIDVAVDSFETSHRKFTLIDAPGHQDFVPNMISGASQADTALLVIDASTGSFESGFSENGQTREHALLVRSLGVQQIVVAVNKLDTVDWSQGRFEEIIAQVEPYLLQCGFKKKKLTFVPCAAMAGDNVVKTFNDIQNSASWYTGPTLVEQLDTLDVPERAIDGPLRMPIANVFKNQSGGVSGIGVSGRIESGIASVGEKVLCLPGDGVGIIRAIELDDDYAPWAAAGSNVTLYLRNIDPSYASVGSIVCEENKPVQIATVLEVQLVMFDLKIPVTIGSAVEVFHQSKDIPARVSKLLATIDKTTGEVIKRNPRMIHKGSWAKVEITLRDIDEHKQNVLPVEPFSINKNLGRLLVRREGETIAAGIILSCS